MTSIIQVHTNEGTYYTNACEKTLEREMWRYIRKKRSAGKLLHEITFVYSRVPFEPAQRIATRLRQERDARRDDLADLEETATEHVTI